MNKFTLSLGSLVMSLGMLFSTHPAYACTRLVYLGPENTILTARSMDWKEDPKSDIWIFPRGMQRNGEIGTQSVHWRSKYGSVITSAYNLSSTDGMNEKGLVANLLWLAETVYPAWDGKKPALSIAAWVQYVLDNFSTVKETVQYMREGHFEVVSDNLPDGSRFATLHLSISDATGDSAIFEYINGKLVIHHGRQYQVMTNSPTFDQQLALNEYWKSIGGLVFLPGTNRAADRFARASYYVNVIPKTTDMRTAVASVFSVIRNTSVPYGITTENEPNISSTRWRVVADQKNLFYFYESTLLPNVFWVDFSKVDFREGSPVKKLELTGGQTYAGETSEKFRKTAPFRFLGIGQ
ncbi:linear amide C-N hydrolase [Oxalobacter vibrioformis]|uniref:Linear amide C-N hydrolase n=1 Tax=Oxalobacter vibrioformis TaxID=933080 RepID=A0A9E9P2W8_9BURK|nr:linear amide C-N hydrolase [Oxalobacter vibrioformis]WAW09433.1 linear amide C-N hydrolase [Oxalobacter vibrioformis]